MSDDTFLPGTFCEVSLPTIQTQDKPLPQATSPLSNLPLLYKSLRSAKSKAEAGAAMRKFIAWNDIPPDVWEKLEDWFPIKK